MTPITRGIALYMGNIGAWLSPKKLTNPTPGVISHHMWRHQTSSMSSSSLRHTLLLQHDAPNYVTPEPWIWAESHKRLTWGVHLHLKVLRIVAPSSEWLRNMATNAPRKLCGRANCAVFGCKNRSSTSEKNEVHFFRFPKDQSRWVVGTNNKLLVAKL